MTDRNEAMDYLASLHGHYAAYHNHKETSGWVSLPVLILLQNSIAGAADADMSDDWKAGFSIGGIVLGVIFLLYMAEQFKLRKKAADLVGAITRLRTEMLIGNVDLDDSQWALPTEDGTSSSARTLPSIVLKYENDEANKVQVNRSWLELLAKTMVILVTAMSVLRILSV